jgi:polysaccharide biosynthesis protein PslH
MKKKALMILPYVPWPLRRGTYQRVYHLAREVAERYDMDLFCLSSEQEDPEHLGIFESFCSDVKFQPFQHGPWPSFLKDRIWHVTPVTVRHWWSDEAFEQLRAFTEGKSYDLVWFCDLVLWPYVKRIFPSHPKIVMDRSRVDWLFQTEELNTLKLNWMDRLMRAENLAKIARMEVDAWRHLALTIVCGPDDKDFLMAKGGPDERVFVLANGANTEFFAAADWPPQPTSYPTSLFCGALDYTPNTDALEWYFDVIHEMILKQCPEYRILLVGKNPTPKVKRYATLPGVEFIGEVEDVRPYYQKAWLQIGNGESGGFHHAGSARAGPHEWE